MQFSIRAVLALTLVTGGLCGLMFGVPEDYLQYAFMVPWAILPGVLISTLVYGRGYVRAFAIGSLPIAIPSAIWALASTFEAEDASTMRIIFVSGLAIIFLSGASSAAIRWVFLPQRATHARKAREIAAGGETAGDTILTGRISVASETREPAGRRPASAVEQALFAVEPELAAQPLRRESIVRASGFPEGPS